jgi:ABC-type antimicrobial peptide transport system permease subunit
VTIVGVVAGIRHRSLSSEPDAEIYRPYLQYLGPAFGAALVVRSSRDPSSLTAAIRHEIRTLYPSQPIGDAKLMTDVVTESVAQPRFYTSLLTVFAALALLLASAGIYGVMSVSVAQRTSEVGIRMALGATSGSVLKLVLGHGLRFVLAGIVIGLAGALALTRLIQSQLYSTSPADPATFAAVSILLIAVSLAAAFLPARRAARVDPMAALRQE